ncbi:MAG: glycosyltransferase family 39 protein [Acidobacteria bacterium]|nr:glycosyltransferase family 39 protein [Acidobacteriota bacterium]
MRPVRYLALAALFLIFAGRTALTYRVFCETFDEHGHIMSGLEVFQFGTYAREAQHPPLARMALGVLPYYFGGLRLEEHHGMWDHRDLAFYWKTLSLARAGNLLFAVMLFWFVYRWSTRLYGAWAGVAACLLVACSPNLIAHAGIATIDFAAAASVLMAAYFFWRWSEQPGWRYCLLSAAAFSCAALSKFSALLFLPPLALVYFAVARWKGAAELDAEALWTGARRAVVFGLVVLFAIWAGYLFEWGTIVPPGHRFTTQFHTGPPASLANILLKIAGPRRLPAFHFAQGLIELASHNQEGHPSYLLGHVANRGYWYYFPVALAVKSTIPMLLLAAVGLVAGGRKSLYPALAAAVVLGVSLPAAINIGIRHVLVVYPLFAILAAGAFASGRQAIRLAALVLAAWHAGESLAAHPDYLAYFNQIARGREERFLVDSNLDWGQDLARLARYLDDHHIDSVYLSYFGCASTERLGVRQHEKLEGWVAISLTHLMMQGEWQWLRGRRPDARVGKSIWLYYLSPGSKPQVSATR